MLWLPSCWLELSFLLSAASTRLFHQLRELMSFYMPVLDELTQVQSVKTGSLVCPQQPCCPRLTGWACSVSGGEVHATPKLPRELGRVVQEHQWVPQPPIPNSTVPMASHAPGGGAFFSCYTKLICGRRGSTGDNTPTKYNKLNMSEFLITQHLRNKHTGKHASTVIFPVSYHR